MPDDARDQTAVRLCRFSVPLLLKPQHRCAHPQVGAGFDEIYFQLRRILHPYARRDLGETNPHDRAGNVLSDDLDRLFGRFRCGNEDQTASGLHRDGKRIVRTDRLDELR